MKSKQSCARYSSIQSERLSRIVWYFTKSLTQDCDLIKLINCTMMENKMLLKFGPRNLD